MKTPETNLEPQQRLQMDLHTAANQPPAGESRPVEQPGQSRLHSGCKRFSWSLVWNSLFVLFELAYLPDYFAVPIDVVARWTLVQVFLIPTLSLVWGICSPRKYFERPHRLELFLFLPVVAIGFFLSEMAFVFSWWNVFPTQFAR